MTTTDFDVFLYELISQKKFNQSIYKELRKNLLKRFNKKPKKRIVKPMTDEGAQRLAAAIIKAAVEEYREAGFKIRTLQYKFEHRLIKNPEAETNHLKAMMNINKRFIETSPIVELMNVDPKWAIETLDSQIESYNPKEHIKIKRGFSRVR